jgi:hypothetical protein
MESFLGVFLQVIIHFNMLKVFGLPSSWPQQSSVSSTSPEPR